MQFFHPECRRRRIFEPDKCPFFLTVSSSCVLAITICCLTWSMRSSRCDEDILPAPKDSIIEEKLKFVESLRESCCGFETSDGRDAQLREKRITFYAEYNFVKF